MTALDDLRSKFKARLPEVIADLRERTAGHDAPRREAGYSIVNAAGDEAVVRIYDEIWYLGVNAQDFARDLDGITAPKMRVEINSPGGDVFDGIAIYNALRAHPAHVTTRVDGIAASIASVIAQAGDTRLMMSGSQMMIHNAWGLTVGNHTDHTEMAAILAHQDAVIAGIYAARSGGDSDRFRALMDAETWMTAQDAVAAGLADEVYEPPVAARASLLEQITALAESPVIDDVERLVAEHGDEGLTGAKRDGLVALRSRIDSLLSPTTPPAVEPVVDREYAEKKRAAAKRDRDFRAALPPHLV